MQLQRLPVFRVFCLSVRKIVQEGKTARINYLI